MCGGMHAPGWQSILTSVPGHRTFQFSSPNAWPLVQRHNGTIIYSLCSSCCGSSAAASAASAAGVVLCRGRCGCFIPEASLSVLPVFSLQILLLAPSRDTERSMSSSFQIARFLSSFLLINVLSTQHLNYLLQRPSAADHS